MDLRGGLGAHGQGDAAELLWGDDGGEGVLHPHGLGLVLCANTRLFVLPPYSLKLNGYVERAPGACGGVLRRGVDGRRWTPSLRRRATLQHRMLHQSLGWHTPTDHLLQHHQAMPHSSLIENKGIDTKPRACIVNTVGFPDVARPTAPALMADSARMAMYDRNPY